MKLIKNKILEAPRVQIYNWILEHYNTEVVWDGMRTTLWNSLKNQIFIPIKP